MSLAWGLVFLACNYIHFGYKTTCITPCGVSGDFTPGTCKELVAAEGKILKAYEGRVKEFVSADIMCVGLQGFKVIIHSRVQADNDHQCAAPAWWGGTECVVGQEHWKEKYIELTDTGFGGNAYTHEVGHAMDEWLNIKETTTHCHWTERGIKEVISTVTGVEDETPESCLSDVSSQPTSTK